VRLHGTPEDETDGWFLDLVIAAAERANGSADFQLVAPADHDAYEEGFDAYLQEWTDPIGSPEPEFWTLPGEGERPRALVIPNHSDEDGSETTDSAEGGPATILVSLETPASAVAEVARWLTRVTNIGLSQREREMVEVIVREIKQADEDGRLDDLDPEDRAQTVVAADTAAAQLRAPRPSRRIVGLALAQIPPYVVGVMSGVSANYLPELIRMLT
jgi:hypothetical protein